MVPLSEYLTVSFYGTADHLLHGESLHDGVTRRFTDLFTALGIVHQLADGGGERGRVVLDEQSVLAVADRFTQPSDAARDHRYRCRHRQQRARPEAFALTDVDEYCSGAQVLFEAPGESNVDAGTLRQLFGEVRALVQQQHGAPSCRLEQRDTVID